MSNNIEESLYTKKPKRKRKFNWADTWEEFDDEYPGLAFTSIILLSVIGIGAAIGLIVQALLTNPWILAYVACGAVIIFIIYAIYKFIKCAQYDYD